MEPDVEIIRNLFKTGQPSLALEKCKTLLESDCTRVNLWKLLSQMYYLNGQLDASYSTLVEAAKLFPLDKEIAFNIGVCCRDLGKVEEAETVFVNYTSTYPDDLAGWVNLSDIQYISGKYEECVSTCQSSIRINPSIPDIQNNLGNSLAKLDLHREAISAFDKALEMSPEFWLAWSNRGSALSNLGRALEAINSCTSAIQINPNFAEGWNNLAVAQIAARRFSEGIDSCNRALRIVPNYAQAHNNKGVALFSMKCYEEALTSYDSAIGIDACYVEAWNNRGNLLAEIKCHGDAAKSYLKAHKYQIKPNFFLGKAHHQMMMVCDWTNFDGYLDRLNSAAEKQIPGPEPFGYQGIGQSESLLLACAKCFSEVSYPETFNARTFQRIEGRRKIRIGYVCGEFYSQATTHLMIGVWEKHDRHDYEVFAFDNGPSDDSTYRARVEAAIPNLINIKRLSDEECASLILELEIDILINLNGYFGNSRTGLFARRPAPVAVNFLGFPGTMGARYIDYILADRIVIPESSRGFYTEKVIYLPNSYQPNDDRRLIDEGIIHRADFGLPEDAFVFCCFNNGYKINPMIFKVWMDILKGVDGSVLWLLSDNPAATGNLRRAADAHSVSPSRLIFAERTSPSKNIARQRLADLFLDTVPYNAHTTASDALWAGLPVLTVLGDTFPGRVGSSLLTAIGLDELIASDLNAYRQAAVHLATHPGELDRIRCNLIKNQRLYPLFDTARFARNLEKAYMAMWERFRAGLPPDHITI